MVCSIPLSSRTFGRKFRRKLKVYWYDYKHYCALSQIAFTNNYSTLYSHYHIYHFGNKSSSFSRNLLIHKRSININSRESQAVLVLSPLYSAIRLLGYYIAIDWSRYDLVIGKLYLIHIGLENVLFIDWIIRSYRIFKQIYTTLPIIRKQFQSSDNKMGRSKFFTFLS